MRVTIAAQAGFLLLGRGGSFGNLREVLVYLGRFVALLSLPPVVWLF